MKKMIFSAVALVAFSFAGMANEIEEKKVEVRKPKKTTTIITVAIQNKQIDEDIIGGASACAKFARNAVLRAAAEYNLDISREGAHFGAMMEMYNLIYLDCYYN